MKFWACVLAIMVPGIVMADIASTTYTDKALSSKADDSAVVHKTGDEIIGGSKTFSNTIVSTSPVAFASPGATLRSNDEAGSLNMHGLKVNQLVMNTENSDSVILSVDDQYDKKIALTMMEKGNPTIELTTNDGYEGSALIMKDDIYNRIYMGKAYTGETNLFMMGENTELALESESSAVTATAGGDAAGIRVGTPNGGILLGTIPGLNNGNPTLWFQHAGKEANISFDSTNFINLSQDLKAPNATIDGVLTVASAIKAAYIMIRDTISPDSDNEIVPNTRWVNDRIEDARGVIPVGGADGTETAQIWIE